MNKHILNPPVPNTWDRRGLPGWCYHSAEFLELEKEEIFRTHWQIVCHVSDLPEPGSFQTFDMCGERALILRDDRNDVRAFHNICRHRGSRLVAKDNGKCRSAMVCPFHGWVYNLDGTLRGAARPDSYPELDKHEFALRSLESEIWNGLVFVRFKKGPQPSVKELFSPIEDEMAGYRAADNVPTGPFWSEVAPVNWKSVRDVDNEGYHVAMAHPALQDLYGSNYFDGPYINGISRTVGQFTPSQGRRWAVRNYKKFSQPQAYLPEELHQAWIYYGLFPNAVIATTPETIMFYQEFPISVGLTQQRSGIYRAPEENRQQRLARYLAHRIDRETFEEDLQLTIWSNESMASEFFEGFHLSDLEYGLRTHHDHLRAILPVCTLDEAPAEAELRALNHSMAKSG